MNKSLTLKLDADLIKMARKFVIDQECGSLSSWVSKLIKSAIFEENGLNKANQAILSRMKNAPFLDGKKFNREEEHSERSSRWE